LRRLSNYRARHAAAASVIDLPGWALGSAGDFAMVLHERQQNVIGRVDGQGRVDAVHEVNHRRLAGAGPGAIDLTAVTADALQFALQVACELITGLPIVSLRRVECDGPRRHGRYDRGPCARLRSSGENRRVRAFELITLAERRRCRRECSDNLILVATIVASCL